MPEPTVPPLDALQTEIDAALAVLAPIIEGLQDYARLNIKPETMTAVTEALKLYQDRQKVLTIAQKALAGLEDNGYPDLPAQEVSALVYDDLRDQEATIEAALAKFKTEEAVTVVITPGKPIDAP